jgi:lysozyme family protein
MADFIKAYDITLGHEGGYSNDPDDAGGETYKGISRVFHPTWDGWIIIDSLKKAPNFPKNLDRELSLQAKVKAFYKIMFWDRFRGDLIPVQSLAEEMFDTGVNMNVTRAVKFLQRALNHLNRNGKLFPDMVDDGKLGPTTLSCLNKYLEEDSVELLLKIMNVMQGNHYLEYMAKSPTQEKYCRGWFNSRVDFNKKTRSA